MQYRNTPHRLLLPALAVGMLTLMAGSASANTSSSGGTGGLVYNAIPSKLAGSVPSQAFEAQQTVEFGDQVTLGGTNRKLQSMSVVLVSWGCQSGSWFNDTCVTPAGATFEVPLTFAVYADNGTTSIASKTKTVNVQYRPSANDARCTGDSLGKWYSKTDRICYNGFAQTFTANFVSGTTLPEGVIWSVAYNTTHYGHAPIGEAQACYTSSGGCGYDSLNVGAFSAANAPYVGTDN